MSLDCNSTKGRGWIAEQNSTASRLAAEWGCEMIGTPDNSAADVDFICCRNGVIQAVLEIKSRNLSKGELVSFGSYLVTLEKLEKGRGLAKSLCCVFVLSVNCIKDNSIIWWTIADKEGHFIPSMECARTRTQDNCNGGVANRYNAYLPINEGNWITKESNAGHINHRKS